MEWALVAYALAQAADVITTLRALGRGGREANPVIAWFMETFGAGWVVLKLAVAALAALVLANAGVVWAIWGLAALVAAVAWRNSRVE